MCDCYDGPPPLLTHERVLAEIRARASRRQDGLMTPDQLGNALGADPAALDTVLRQMERAGIIVASPSVGRVAIVILGESDDRSLRRSVQLNAPSPPEEHTGRCDPTPPRAPELRL